MIPPLADPPHRTTAHGATCSPRLSRLYTWLNANGVGLSDFSTDECVLRFLPRLRKLAAELNTYGATAQGSTATYIDHLAVDLANIMRRVPSARVTR